MKVIKEFLSILRKNIEGAQKSQPLMFFSTYSSSSTTQLYYKYEI